MGLSPFGLVDEFLVKHRRLHHLHHEIFHRVLVQYIRHKLKPVSSSRHAIVALQKSQNSGYHPYHSALSRSSRVILNPGHPLRSPGSLSAMVFFGWRSPCVKNIAVAFQRLIDHILQQPNGQIWFCLAKFLDNGTVHISLICKRTRDLGI